MHGYIKYIYAMDDCNKYKQHIMDDSKQYKVRNG